ncbi:WYL domain-containing protein [Collinsella sp. An2]|uniref:helix-turn-helix transcriptional regulator n=1 Tax=Collinsella sp. An2 TaxID=1965585 RepID=UPI000B386FB1|nr:WYL domain-containing protein [Collinsella sp. An2]OUP10438.1 hypothetical protein B5F33_02365 [Collinsella sp. An2]
MPSRSTEREDAAQRLLNLVFTLSCATMPLTTEQIVSDTDLGYGSDNRASDLRKFRRDREELARQGILITEVRPEGTPETDPGRWAIDRERTFAAGGIVTADDADLLVHAIDDYLSVPGNPLARPLSSVRRKLVAAGMTTDTLSADGGEGPTDGKASSLSPMLDAVWTSYALRLALPIAYRDARGNLIKRTVSIYGLFSLDGRTYFTGLDDHTNTVRTFRIDRVERAWRPKGSYVIPPDFNIRDHLFLPFDFSRNEAMAARFTLPDSTPREEALAIGGGRGSLKHDDEHACWTWDVEVRDLRAAAAFALAHARSGLRPVQPKALVDCWCELVKEAIARHENR